jgi:hypothetical protein
MGNDAYLLKSQDEVSCTHLQFLASIVKYNLAMVAIYRIK